jgi:predicted permease
MAVGSSGGETPGKTLIAIPRRVLLHLFIVATPAGFAATAIDCMLTFRQSSAAPCTLFALGVTVAVRPLKRVGGELPVLIAIKLVLHPLIAFVILT